MNHLDLRGREINPWDLVVFSACYYEAGSHFLCFGYVSKLCPTLIKVRTLQDQEYQRKALDVYRVDIFDIPKRILLPLVHQMELYRNGT